MKTLKIVIEETNLAAVDTKGNPGTGFNVYLEGITEEEMKMLDGLPREKWSAAEFWGIHLFQICGEALAKAGAIYKPVQKN